MRVRERVDQERSRIMGRLISRALWVKCQRRASPEPVGNWVAQLSDDDRRLLSDLKGDDVALQPREDGFLV